MKWREEDRVVTIWGNEDSLLLAAKGRKDIRALYTVAWHQKDPYSSSWATLAMLQWARLLHVFTIFLAPNPASVNVSNPESCWTCCINAPDNAVVASQLQRSQPALTYFLMCEVIVCGVRGWGCWVQAEKICWIYIIMCSTVL